MVLLFVLVSAIGFGVGLDGGGGVGGVGGGVVVGNIFAVAEVLRVFN